MRKQDLALVVIRGAREYSIGAVLFHQAVGQLLGVNVTDMKCLDIMTLKGSASPTDLAEHTSLSPDHAPHAPFLHVGAAHTRRRPVRPDRCAATRNATRLGLICLARRRIGARRPAAHPLDGARRSATARNNRPSGQLVGS